MKQRLIANLGDGSRTLLAARVFGSEHVATIINLLADQWQWLGPVRFIGGWDSFRYLSKHGGWDMNFANIAKILSPDLFIKDSYGAYSAVDRLSVTRGKEGTFSTSQLMCTDAVWRLVFARLLARADVALVDLSGFSKEHEGTIYELEELLQSLDVRRIIIVVDGATATSTAFGEVLYRTWAAVGTDSPNAHGLPSRLRVLRMREQHAQKEVDGVVAALMDAAFEPKTSPSP